MSEDIKVSFSAIQQLATDVQNESNKIQSSLDTLDGEVKKLYGSWDGQAQQAYQNSKAKWDQKMADMHSILQELHGKVGEAGIQYQNTEARNASRFEAWGGRSESSCPIFVLSCDVSRGQICEGWSCPAGRGSIPLKESSPPSIHQADGFPSPHTGSP